MTTNALFPFLLEPLGTGGSGPPSGVVGGFIEAVVQAVPQAVAQGSPINAGVQASAVRATVVPTFTAQLGGTIRAVVQPSPIVAEINDGQ